MGKVKTYYHAVGDEKLKLTCYVHTNSKPPYVDLNFGDLSVYLDEIGVGIMIEELTKAREELEDKRKEVSKC